MMKQTEVPFQTLVAQSMLGVQSKSSKMMSTGASTAPMIALVDRLIQKGLALRASDIHIEPMQKDLRVRYRVDGILTEGEEAMPVALLPNMVSRVKIMAGMDTIERRKPLDGRISYPYAGTAVDIRVSTIPVMDGEKVVLRLLSGAQRLLQLDELDFSPENAKLFHEWIHAPYGMILNVGPVNSGKTTTLYAALHALNATERNVVTIEDPVEYYLPGVNQVQIDAKMELTFAAGLRALLRQDPDVCMVGEIRDEETAEIAVRAALTGRLLFSTLHTGNAVGAIFRLLDMKVKPYFLLAALRGIMAQRLVRRLCPHCKTAYAIEAGSDEARFMGSSYRAGMTAYRGEGCEACRGTGYWGRVAIHELLPMTETMQEAIANGVKMRDLEGVARECGMRSLREDGMDKALAGVTSIQEVQRAVFGDV